MILKCPLCLFDIEVLAKGTAHDHIELHGYCGKCDAVIEVVCPESSVPVNSPPYPKS